ncbi:IMMP1L (predicted) [Pycnogonum litorale]
MTFIKSILQTAGFSVKYGCIAYCTVQYVADVVICSGPSMEPTITDNNLIIAEHLSPRFGKIDRHDIVICRNPSKPNEYICKRIKGLPGDRINNLSLLKSTIVPRGHVWLEGDNASNSTDSRDYGAVPQALICGRVMCKLWPLEDAKTF